MIKISRTIAQLVFGSTITLMFLLLVSPVSSQQTFQWGVKGGGISTDVINDIASEGDNVYATGRFSGNFIFNNEETEGQAMTDIYFLKLDKKGNTIWMQTLTGEGAGNGSRVLTGEKNIFLGGTISGVVKHKKDVYDGEDKALFVSSWNKQGKIDWFTRLPFEGNATLDVLEVSSDGSMIIGGLLQGKLTIDGTELLTPRNKRAFLINLTKDGNLVGAKLSSGEGSHRLVSAAFDTKNNRYSLFSVSGNFLFTDDNPVIIPNSTKNGLVLQKTNSEGKLIWTKTFESSGYLEGTKVIIGNGDEVIVCANYNETLKTSDTIYNTNAQLETMLFSLNSVGDQLWAKKLTSTVKTRVMDVSNTRNGNLMIAGYFRQSYSIDGDSVYSEIPGEDLFLLQLNKKGETVWHDEPGEEASSFCKAFTIDETGNIIFAGGFRGELELKSEKLTSAGKEDILIAKYFNCDQNNVTIIGDNTLCEGGETELTATGGYYSYLWNAEEWGENTYLVASPGIYTVTAFDKQGCATSDTFNITIAESEALNLPDELELSQGDKILISAEKGFASYLWEDGSTYPEREVSYNPEIDSEELDLIAETFEGCIVTDTIMVKYNHTKSAGISFNAFIQAYPNPVKNKLTWFAKTEKPTDVNLILTDSKGVTVYNQQISGYIPNSVEEIDMSGLAGGNYLLKIKAGEIVHDLKIVKK